MRLPINYKNRIKKIYNIIYHNVPQVLRSSLLRLHAFFTLHDSPASHKPAAILLTAHW
jgi:hypothetical protein